jgi:hypothetical protein
MSDNVIPFPGGGEIGPHRGHLPDAPATPSSYDLHIDLVDANPPIWRRLRLRGDLTLDRVHQAIQRAMGWQDSHLHRFVVPSDGPVFVSEYDEEDGEAGIPEASVRLDQVLLSPGDEVGYEYDFGDGWEHAIAVERTGPYGDGSPAAVCLAGERACPPEDVGGIYHYNEVVAWLTSPDPDALLDDPHLAQTIEWLPLDFDAARLEVDEINRILALCLDASPPAVPNVGYRAFVGHLDAHGRRYLDELATLADLRGALPGHDDITVAVGPYLTLLDVVGPQGLQLTSAGYLPPADTERLFKALGYDDSWPGMGQREASTPPVRHLRESAQALGLVRRHRGRLVRTPAGRATAGEPYALWSRILARLPLGRHEHERDAGVLALLCQATGSDARRVFDRYAAGLLELAGWSLPDDRLRLEDAAFGWARPTWQVLWTVGHLGHKTSDVGPNAAHLARAALLSDGQD